MAGSKPGFLGAHYKDLVPGPGGGAQLRWLKPGVDFKKYDKVMLDSVVFFAEDSEYRGIDPVELKELAAAFNHKMVDTLKDRYPIVAAPGLAVVRLRFAIKDLNQSRPVVSGITTVVPVGLGISILKKGATGLWSGSGATGGELMVLDSSTNEVAKDDRTADFSERFTKWGSAEEAFAFWARRGGSGTSWTRSTPRRSSRGGYLRPAPLSPDRERRDGPGSGPRSRRGGR